MKRTWSDYQLFQLAMLYPFFRTEHVADLLNKSIKAAATKAKVHNIRKVVFHYGQPSTSNPKTDKFLQENYLTMPVRIIEKNIGRSRTFILTRMRQLGLVIPKEIIEQRIRECRIQPGAVPVNKGKKQSEFMSPEGIKRTLATRFKKGQRIHNEGKNGDIRVRHNHKNRGDKPYKWIRIRKGKWEMLHVNLWKENHGRIPNGMIVVFKDGDTMNCKLENLELITREENMKRNTIHRYPEELKQVIRLSNKLERKIQSHHEKQITRPEKPSVRAA